MDKNFNAMFINESEAQDLNVYDIKNVWYIYTYY
jgi:hypothetical protein